MAAISATKPYVVADGAVAPAVAPQVETRTGWVTFAGIVLLVGAVANFFWGLAALDSKAYLDESGLLYGTLETWGWIAVGWSALLADRRHPAARADRGRARRRDHPRGRQLLLLAVRAARMPFYAMTVILIDLFVIYGVAAHSTE